MGNIYLWPSLQFLIKVASTLSFLIDTFVQQNIVFPAGVNEGYVSKYKAI